MKLQIEREDDISIIIPYGEMLAGQGDSELRDALTDLLEQGHVRVVVDFSHVPYIDSSILGQLVHGYTRLEAEGGDLKLANPSSRIRDVLELTRLISIFDVHTDRSSALGAF